MNLRNKILIPLFALGTLLLGCDDLIYDELDNCPQGVYVKFYSMTPCALDSTYVGEVSSLMVFAFDKNDKLVTSVTKENVNLTSDYELFLPVSDGYFSFIGWTGIDNNFTRSAFVSGTTTKKDIMATLNSEKNLAASLKGVRVWQGESPSVFLPDPSEFGEVYKHTEINLNEQTNRVKILVEFDKSITALSPKDLAITLASANGTININGSMPLNTTQLLYPIQQTTYTEKSVVWDYTLLKLLTGYNNRLTITYPATGAKVFDGDLLAGILLNTVAGGVNLACQNDFTVKFLVKNYCADCNPDPKPEPGTDPNSNSKTYFSCAVYVNDWLVHTYDTELGL